MEKFGRSSINRLCLLSRIDNQKALKMLELLECDDPKIYELIKKIKANIYGNASKVICDNIDLFKNSLKNYKYSIEMCSQLKIRFDNICIIQLTQNELILKDITDKKKIVKSFKINDCFDFSEMKLLEQEYNEKIIEFNQIAYKKYDIIINDCEIKQIS